MKKRIISVVLSLILALTFVPGGLADNGNGQGSSSRFLVPIESQAAVSVPISNRAELEAIKNNLSGTFHLTNDIDLSGDEWIPIGDNSTYVDAPFTGTFDGQGHVIRNLTITGERKCAGLFGCVRGATIKNVGMEGTFIDVRYISHGIGIYSAYAGAVCGAGSADIRNCYNAGSITSTNQAGGIIGRIGETGPSSISDCYNTGKISTSSSSGGGGSSAGGICAESWNGVTISKSFNIGEVSARTDYSSLAGGICAYSHDVVTIVNCYNTGNVTALLSGPSSGQASPDAAGGLCGTSYGRLSVRSSYNAGKVTAPAFDVRWDSYGSSSVVSYYRNSDVNSEGQGVPLTSAQMKKQSSFAGFDFDSVWEFRSGENNGYPVLRALSFTPAVMFGGGSGTVSDPYIIKTAEHLAFMAALVNAGDAGYGDKHYRLANDIDLSDYGAGWNGGSGWIPIGNRWPEWGCYFSGVFDGNGKTITGLYINSRDGIPNTADGICTGLFGNVIDGTIKNLGVKGEVNSINRSDVGGLVGTLQHGTLENCYFTGSVNSTGSSVGGIVGVAFRNSMITGSYSIGTVTGDGWVGGIVGSLQGGSVVDCRSTAAVSGEQYHIGGIVGSIVEYDRMISRVENCSAFNSIVRGLEGVGRVVGARSTTYHSDEGISVTYDILSGNTALASMTGGPFSGERTHDGCDGADFEAPNLGAASSWARDGITAAVAKGYVPAEIQGGYTGVITRAEFCRMAVKWLEYRLGKKIDVIVAERGLPERMDHSFSDTADPDILAAYRLGVTAGELAPADTVPGRFVPDGKLTREQAATMIRNTCEAAGMDISNVALAGFRDIDIASGWAVDAINFVRNAGIMSGTGNDSFSPKDTYTREQGIVTFGNI